MKSVLTITAILGAASTIITAAPLERREAIIYPAVTSQYTVSTGAVAYNTYYGLVSKSSGGSGNTNGQQSDITTLVTFDLSTVKPGSTCEFVFTLNANDYGAKVGGSHGADVFTSIAPAKTTSTSSWPSGNLRDQSRGRFVASVGGGLAQWQSGFPSNVFPCPSGMLLGAEIVGFNDVDILQWTAGQSGLSLVVTP